MKPSDFKIGKNVPFMDTLQKAEAETALGWLMLAFQRNGDSWDPVSSDVLRDILIEAQGGKYPWMFNRFLKPEFFHLEDKGLVDISADKPSKLRMTKAGMEFLEKYLESGKAPQ